MNSRQEAAERRRILEKARTIKAETLFSMPLLWFGRLYVSRLMWTRDRVPQERVRWFVIKAPPRPRR